MKRGNESWEVVGDDAESFKQLPEALQPFVRQMLGLYRNTEQVKPVSVNTIIEDTLLLLNRQLQRANVEVQTELQVLPDAVIAADQIR